MRFIQSLCVMLAVMIGLLLGAAFMMNSANAQTTVVVAAESCDATNGPCDTGQGIGITILPPGSTPPPTTPPPSTPPPTAAPTEQPGPGGGRNPGANTPPKNLPKTGPRETAIMAAAGLGVLQLGLIMAVRAGRAQRSGRLAA